MQGLRPLPRKYDYVETGHVQLHSDMCFKCFKKMYCVCITYSKMNILENRRLASLFNISDNKNNTYQQQKKTMREICDKGKIVNYVFDVKLVYLYISEEKLWY